MNLESQINDHINTVILNKNHIIEFVNIVSPIILSRIKNGGKLYLCGNGGSAADAQHIAAEFTGRFLKERRGLPAIALTTDTSAITAIGNDYNFDNIFSRQVEALLTENDVLLGISTSGNSRNIIKAIELANRLNCVTVSFTGNDGGSLQSISNYNMNVNSKITARIQEIHILIGHLICSEIDNNY